MAARVVASMRALLPAKAGWAPGEGEPGGLGVGEADAVEAAGGDELRLAVILADPVGMGCLSPVFSLRDVAQAPVASRPASNKTMGSRALMP